MTEIESVERVEAGGYTVRVGRSEEYPGWDAVVLEEPGPGGSGGSGGGPRLTSTPVGMVLTTGSGGDGGGGEPDPGSPVVTAPHKWVAVGFAIEAHEWQPERETETLGDAYGMAEDSAGGGHEGFLSEGTSLPDGPDDAADALRMAGVRPAGGWNEDHGGDDGQ